MLLIKMEILKGLKQSNFAMKGIILAGGSGTRLQPMTNALSKQILPVYDKPMIHYPLSTLMNFGITEILIISTPRDLPIIEKILGDGSNLGLRLSYKIQDEPKGIAEAFIIGEEFIGNDTVCLILGDNIFYGSEIVEAEENIKFKPALEMTQGAYILAYQVSDPQRYGIVELAKGTNQAVSIEEKPKKPKSNLAVTGLYFYDNQVVDIAKNLTPSARGELEITDVNKEYLRQDQLNVIKMGRGFAWLDAGTPDSLLDAAQYVQTVEHRQGVKIACLEEIALLKSFIDQQKYETLLSGYKEGSDYHAYLKTILKEYLENE
jgi:glucose-1-phosphate thymidylyltransferase